MPTLDKSTRSTGNRPARRPSSGGGGGGFWLVVALAVGAVAAVYVLAPDLPRRLLGLATAPRDAGPAPTAPEGSQTVTQQKDPLPPRITQAPATGVRTAPVETAPVKPVAQPIKATAKDEAKATAILADAEKSYKAFQWQHAIDSARKISDLDVTAETAVRAKDIEHGADALEKIFTQLNDRDELSRHFDTDPKLVVLKGDGTPSYAVPIISMDSQTPVEGDALDYIAAQRKTGKVTLLIKGKKDYMATVMPADSLGEVVAADLPTIVAQKQSELDARITRLKANPDSPAMDWYYAGRFAYRNRLDAKVTELMDQALLRDPFLAKSVREDKAATLYSNMISHIRNGSDKQAAQFMSIIDRKFADTDKGKEARLFYDKKTGELLKAAQEADVRRVAQLEVARQQRIERAKKLNDTAAVAKLEKQPAGDPIDEAPAAPTGSIDTGGAEDLYKKGYKLYAQAQTLGATPERNTLYHQAEQTFSQAMGIYRALLEKNPNDEALQAKARECNQLKFGAHKYQTE